MPYVPVVRTVMKYASEFGDVTLASLTSRMNAPNCPSPRRGFHVTVSRSGSGSRLRKTVSPAFRLTAKKSGSAAALEPEIQPDAGITCPGNVLLLSVSAVGAPVRSWK